jgi:hypothetical protein
MSSVSSESSRIQTLQSHRFVYRPFRQETQDHSQSVRLQLESATGGYTGAVGTVVSWTPGLAGYTGTSELVLTNVVGTFTSAVQGAAVGSTLDVFDVSTKTRAGTEGRDLLAPYRHSNNFYHILSMHLQTSLLE